MVNLLRRRGFVVALDVLHLRQLHLDGVGVGLRVLERGVHLLRRVRLRLGEVVRVSRHEFRDVALDCRDVRVVVRRLSLDRRKPLLQFRPVVEARLVHDELDGLPFNRHVSVGEDRPVRVKHVAVRVNAAVHVTRAAILEPVEEHLLVQVERDSAHRRIVLRLRESRHRVALARVVAPRLHEQDGLRLVRPLAVEGQDVLRAKIQGRREPATPSRNRNLQHLFHPSRPPQITS